MKIELKTGYWDELSIDKWHRRQEKFMYLTFILAGINLLAQILNLAFIWALNVFFMTMMILGILSKTIYDKQGGIYGKETRTTQPSRTNIHPSQTKQEVTETVSKHDKL